LNPGPVGKGASDRFYGRTRIAAVFLSVELRDVVVPSVPSVQKIAWKQRYSRVMTWDIRPKDGPKRSQNVSDGPDFRL